MGTSGDARVFKLLFLPKMLSRRIIDIHQHITYTGRSDAQLIQHQREMGATKTVLLPAGSKYGLAAGALRERVEAVEELASPARLPTNVRTGIHALRSDRTSP